MSGLMARQREDDKAEKVEEERAELEAFEQAVRDQQVRRTRGSHDHGGVAATSIPLYTFARA